MPRGKKELAEQIIPKLREVEVEAGRGKTVLEAVKKIGVTERTCYRWKKQYVGLRIDQAKRLKDIEKENSRLKRLLADAELDKAVLREDASVNFWARRSGGERSSMSEMLSALIDWANAGHVSCLFSIETRSDAASGMFQMMNLIL
jgi:transposase